jgi:AbrB family looped-hinge helix DNA binding protein
MRLMMTIYRTLDDSARVVIPKKMREALHLEPGDTLEIESAGATHSFCACGNAAFEDPRSQKPDLGTHRVFPTRLGLAKKRKCV